MAQRKSNWVYRFAGLAGLVLSNTALSSTAAAEPHAALPEPLTPQLIGLATGDQLIVSNIAENVAFAGHDMALRGFTGVFGYASDLAYVLVIEGEAEIGGVRAGSGRMLLVPPFGGEIASERFDAARLHAAFERQGATWVPAALDDLAREQSRGIFLGRLGRTGFNVTTLGSAEQELTRRARTGGGQVRNLRFSASAADETLEQSVVSQFLAALARGDAEAVAEMLDPAPYGLVHGTPEASAARLAMARALIARSDWRAFAGAVPVNAGSTSWIAHAGDATAAIDLNPTRDFTFIRSIELEG